MVEPIEETRAELVFATEPLLSSLLLSIPMSSRSSAAVELDEVEVSMSTIFCIRRNDLNYTYLDTKRHLAALQRVVVPAYICSPNPFKFNSGNRPDQCIGSSNAPYCSDLLLILAQGDWKVGGLGLTISLTGTDGTPTSWSSPIHDSYLPSYVQRSFDYMGKYNAYFRH